MNTYREQVHCTPAEIDIDFWRAPEGVEVPDDDLRFLLIPDAVEAIAVFEVSQQVHQYQQAHASDDGLITRALMATMGGLLPGVLLYDHLRNGRPAETPLIEFGSIGVSLYKGPNERYENPRVVQDISVPVQNEVMLLIDDLGDRGDTLQFLLGYLKDKGAKDVLSLALYMKPQAMKACPANFFFGTVPQDTWIITPREYVETMAKRVPVWRGRGANAQECYRRLVDIIGYPTPIVDYYLEKFL
jgi:hypoxanthine phosphoribosyltransferase